MTVVLLIIHLFVTLALIGVVLIQRSEGGGKSCARIPTSGCVSHAQSGDDGSCGHGCMGNM